MTGAGFSAGFGLSNTTHETAMYQKTVITNSRRNIGMIPHMKLGFEGFVKVVDANKFDTLITDREALEEELTKIQDCGVDVVVTDEPQI